MPFARLVLLFSHYERQGYEMVTVASYTFCLLSLKLASSYSGKNKKYIYRAHGRT